MGNVIVVPAGSNPTQHAGTVTVVDDPNVPVSEMWNRIVVAAGGTIQRLTFMHVDVGRYLPPRIRWDQPWLTNVGEAEELRLRDLGERGHLPRPGAQQNPGGQPQPRAVVLFQGCRLGGHDLPPEQPNNPHTGLKSYLELFVWRGWSVTVRVESFPQVGPPAGSAGVTAPPTGAFRGMPHPPRRDP